MRGVIENQRSIVCCAIVHEFVEEGEIGQQSIEKVFEEALSVDVIAKQHDVIDVTPDGRTHVQSVLEGNNDGYFIMPSVERQLPDN